MKPNVKICVSSKPQASMVTGGTPKPTAKLLRHIFDDAPTVTILVPGDAVMEVSIATAREGGAESAT